MILRFIRSSIRIPSFLIMTMIYVLGLFFLRIFAGADRMKSHKLLLHYIQNVYRLMGIRVFVEGELPNEPTLLMGNHRSYVDTVMIPSKIPMTYVARSESRSWPIIGWGASLLGTIWVDRKSKSSRKRTREAVKERLESGFGIIIFPEGTTHRGPDLLEYRPSMFYICAEHGFPITPIAIEYKDPNIAWVGKTMFIPHAWKHFGARTIDVKVSYGKTFRGIEGGEMLNATREWTQKEVLRLRQEWDKTLTDTA